MATQHNIYFKVVSKDGGPTHAAYNFRWSLPTKTKPGRWHRVKLPLKVCRNGFHVTEHPEQWILSVEQAATHRRRLFICEIRGARRSRKNDICPKVVAESARLLYEVSWPITTWQSDATGATAVDIDVARLTQMLTDIRALYTKIGRPRR